MNPYLYHGTSWARAQKIVRDRSMRPRGSSKGNWEIESNPNAIYLTEAYALHYAASATKGDGDMAIVEVDTTLMDPKKFIRDEDAIEQLGRGRDDLPTTWSVVERTRFYRENLSAVPAFGANESLKVLGNCAYLGRIQLIDITRIIRIEAKAWGRLVLDAGIDPVIHFHNYQMMGDFYRASSSWIAGREPADKPGFISCPVFADDGTILEHRDVPKWKMPLLPDREGITIYQVKGGKLVEQK